MVEYADPAERAERLAQLIGIEDKVWMQVDGCDRVYPIADEDLERSNETKTSSVHFLRFELSQGMVAAVQSGAGIVAGIDHPAYPLEPVRLAAEIRDSLAADLQAATLN